MIAKVHSRDMAIINVNLNLTAPLKAYDAYLKKLYYG